jgi:predicted RNase H-like HicB family nuclease
MGKMQKIVLNITFYREGKMFIAYSPALNLSTCGDSEEQARERFEEALKIFLEEVDKMGTLEDVLAECGWTKVAHPRKHWQPPIYVGQSQREVRLPCPA